MSHDTNNRFARPDAREVYDGPSLLDLVREKTAAIKRRDLDEALRIAKRIDELEQLAHRQPIRLT